MIIINNELTDIERTSWNKLSENVTSIFFSYEFNLRVNDLPHICFGQKFNRIIHTLPPSLTWLSFQTNFNYPISCLPASLTRLKFGDRFDSSPFPLPQNLERLYFSYHFNQPLPYLPSKLKRLTIFSSEFNQVIPTLPQRLQKFIFSVGKMSHPLPPLPYSLTTLKILANEEYEHKIDASSTMLSSFFAEYYCDISLPPTISSISSPYMASSSSVSKFELLGGEIYGPYDKLPTGVSTIIVAGDTHIEGEIEWPPTLTYLEICTPFKEQLDSLPPSLTFLSLHSKYNLQLNSLPVGLITLHLDAIKGSLNNLPHSLLHLILYEGGPPIDHLPPFLTSLIITSDFNYEVDSLPSSLTYLSIASNIFNQTLDHLPNSITYLDLSGSNNFNRAIKHLPISLLKLGLGSKFNSTIDHFPPSLCKLWFSEESVYNQLLPFIPSSLTKMKVPPQVLTKHFIPASLKSLTVYCDSLPVSEWRLPSSVHKLVVWFQGRYIKFLS